MSEIKDNDMLDQHPVAEKEEIPAEKEQAAAAESTEIIKLTEGEEKKSSIEVSEKNELAIREDEKDLSVKTDSSETANGEKPQEKENAEIDSNEESDDFEEELAEIEHEAEDNEIIKNLGDSINKQVELEIGSLSPEESSETENEEKEQKKGIIGFFSRVPKWIYITLGIAAFIAVLILILDATGLGEKLLIKLGAKVVAVTVDYQPVDAEKTEIMPELVDDISEFKEEMKLTPIPTEVITPTPEPTPVPELYEKKIINILLLGEENIGSYSSRGRTDMIVLATIDTVSKTLKLTSIMRDCFVQIPGYDDNRINAAYALGGVPLLYATIEKNFGITPDNYILVRFDDFEKMVDSVGGIDITLSKKEATYLNSTNYISKPQYRTVVEGLNHMNGNQALGYSRIRYVAKDGEKNDFGRTTRHRVVISALVNQVKSLGYTDLINVGFQCLPMVTTDVTADEIERYTHMILDIGGADITILENRVPIDGSYKFVTIRKMSVTQIDITKNREALHDFIYGDYDEEADRAASSVSGESSESGESAGSGEKTGIEKN